MIAHRLLGRLLASLPFFTIALSPALGCGGDSTSASEDRAASSGPPIVSGLTAASTTQVDGAAQTAGNIKTVFLILMENHSWTATARNPKLTHLKGDTQDAPYINGPLVATAAHADGYSTPPNNHPSEPNYLWLEAGGNLGVTNDDPPSVNHQATTDHLTTQLESAGFTWKTYAEGISGTTCPLTDDDDFAVRHVPQLFFDDTTDDESATSATCIAHVRPYTELATDLAAGTVAQYNFITPNLCDDMHGDVAIFADGYRPSCVGPDASLISAGDRWLSTEIPKITASSAYANGAVIFIAWDEGTAPSLVEGAVDGPLPFFVLSTYAKAGYAGGLTYTHSSTLRTIETIFGLPFLRDAANARDLSDLFTSFP